MRPLPIDFMSSEPEREPIMRQQFSHYLLLTALAGVLSLCVMQSSHAQLLGGGFVNRSVGGVSVDAEGVLSAPTINEEQELQRVREQTKIDVPAELEKFTELRAVSLRQLESAIAKAVTEKTSLAEEVLYLAGLQRVEYVIAYPERNDIVLAGPAEGWKLDGVGNVVGATTNRPVLLLDDLLVALRSGPASRVEAITCSIDPTPEGLQRWQKLARGMTRIGNPDQTMRRIEEALGPQVISVTGISPNTHFARAMVAADFRMKRLAMDFEPAPVGNMPSFLKMLRSGGASSMMPRWWLAPNYQPLAQTKDGLTWQLRGPGVKCMTEQDYLDGSGNKQHSGKAHPVAQKWADTMTKNFGELATHDSAFGQLRNVMDLSVIGALIEKQQLLVQVGLKAPHLMAELQPANYPAPRYTSSKASFVKRGKKWLISASGGVEILPWQIADSSETVDSLSKVRDQLTQSSDGLWWE